MDCDAQKLAALVGERRPIYDFTLKEHNNRDLIDALWEEVALHMNTTVAHCKAKWCNIRNCYSRYLRTTRNFPSPLTGRRKKKWYLADTLAFLDPFMSQTRKMEQSFEELPLEVIHEFKEDPESSDSLNVQSLPNVVAEFKSEDEGSEPKRKMPKTGMDFQYGRPGLVFREEVGMMPADPDFDFFKCLFFDYKKLRPRRQRKFKETMLSTLHRLLDQEEEEQSGAASPKNSDQPRVNTSQHPSNGSPKYANVSSDTEEEGDKV